MAETRRKFDHDFREGAGGLVRETVSRSRGGPGPGDQRGTLGNRVNADRQRRGEGNGALGEDERAELARLRREKKTTSNARAENLVHVMRPGDIR